jgi:phthalate 4,5-dioxygenase reductase component
MTAANDIADKHRDKCFTIELAKSNLVIPVGSNESILEALEKAGIATPSSCRSGTCGTCRTRLVSGDADHRDFVLFDDEQADTIMVCVSRSLSDRLVLDL